MALRRLAVAGLRPGPDPKPFRILDTNKWAACSVDLILRPPMCVWMKVILVG